MTSRLAAAALLALAASSSAAGAGDLKKTAFGKPRPAVPSVEVGAKAPDFTLPDLSGNEVTLSTLRGRRVVLEWFNPECPFARYAHTKGPLREMADEAQSDGITWLAINSAGAGRQGHGSEKNLELKTRYHMKHPILLDERGKVGRMYGARTTPQMFVIDGHGILVYRGALDNALLGDLDRGELINYVSEALASLAVGKPVQLRETRPYGCSVKYAIER